mgnify:CR=1 FL=1
MERAEILGVGTELLYGETLDTNTAEIARSLKPYALKVERTLRVADEVAPLAREVEEAVGELRGLVSRLYALEARLKAPHGQRSHLAANPGGGSSGGL